MWLGAAHVRISCIEWTRARWISGTPEYRVVTMILYVELLPGRMRVRETCTMGGCVAISNTYLTHIWSAKVLYLHSISARRRLNCMHNNQRVLKSIAHANICACVCCAAKMAVNQCTDVRLILYIDICILQTHADDVHIMVSLHDVIGDDRKHFLGCVSVCFGGFQQCAQFDCKYLYWHA